MKRRPPILTRTAHLFPYTTLFLSDIHPERHDAVDEVVARGDGVEHRAHRGDLLVAFGERLGHLEGGHRGHGRNDRCRAPNPSCSSHPLRARRPAATRRRGVRARCSRSEEHTSELQSLMRTSYAVFCLKKKHLDSPTHHVTTTYSIKHNKYKLSLAQ